MPPELYNEILRFYLLEKDISNESIVNYINKRLIIKFTSGRVTILLLCNEFDFIHNSSKGFRLDIVNISIKFIEEFISYYEGLELDYNQTYETRRYDGFGVERVFNREKASNIKEYINVVLPKLKYQLKCFKESNNF